MFANTFEHDQRPSGGSLGTFLICGIIVFVMGFAEIGPLRLYCGESFALLI